MLVLGRLVLAGRLLVGRLLVSLLVIEISPRIVVAVPAMRVMAPVAGRKSASAAAINVYPTIIFADLTLPRTRVLVVVVITVDPQSSLELGDLLPARAWIRAEISGSAASCSNVYASGSTNSNSRLVVVSALTIPPFRPTAIAKFCFAATTGMLLAAKSVALGFAELTACGDNRYLRPQDFHIGNTSAILLV